MDSLDIELKTVVKEASVTSKEPNNTQDDTQEVAKLNLNATSKYLSAVSNKKGLLTDSQNRTFNQLNTNLNTYIQDKKSLDNLEVDDDSAQMGHYRKLTVQVINRDPNLQEKVASDLSTSRELVRSKDAASTLEDNLKNLPDSLKEGTAAGKNLGKFICQSVVNLTDYENMGAGLQRDLSIRDVYAPSEELSPRSKMATADALSASIAYVKSNQPEVLATLQEEQTVDKVKPGSTTPQVMTRYLRQALDEFPKDSTYLDIFKQNKDKQVKDDYADNISKETAKRIHDLVLKAATTARRGNLIQNEASTTDVKEVSVQGTQTQANTQSEELVDASKLSLSELSARAAKLQQQFREERQRLASEGKLPDPATRPQSPTIDEVTLQKAQEVENAISQKVANQNNAVAEEAISNTSQTKESVLSAEEIKKLALEAVKEALKESVKSQIEATTNTAKAVATEAVKALKDELLATQNQTKDATTQVVNELKETVKTQIEQSQTNAKQVAQDAVKEVLNQSVKAQIEASQTSTIDATTKAFNELKESMTAKLEATNQNAKATADALKQALEQSVKSQLESKQSSNDDLTAKALSDIKELKETFKSQLEASTNSAKEAAAQAVKEALKETVKAQLESKPNLFDEGATLAPDFNKSSINVSFKGSEIADFNSFNPAPSRVDSSIKDLSALRLEQELLKAKVDNSVQETTPQTSAENLPTEDTNVDLQKELNNQAKTLVTDTDEVLKEPQEKALNNEVSTKTLDTSKAPLKQAEFLETLAKESDLNTPKAPVQLPQAENTDTVETDLEEPKAQSIAKDNALKADTATDIDESENLSNQVKTSTPLVQDEALDELNTKPQSSNKFVESYIANANKSILEQIEQANTASTNNVHEDVELATKENAPKLNQSEKLNTLVSESAEVTEDTPLVKVATNATDAEEVSDTLQDEDAVTQDETKYKVAQESSENDVEETEDLAKEKIVVKTETVSSDEIDTETQAVQNKSVNTAPTNSSQVDAETEDANVQSQAQRVATQSAPVIDTDVEGNDSYKATNADEAALNATLKVLDSLKAQESSQEQVEDAEQALQQTKAEQLSTQVSDESDESVDENIKSQDKAKSTALDKLNSFTARLHESQEESAEVNTQKITTQDSTAEDTTDEELEGSLVKSNVNKGNFNPFMAHHDEETTSSSVAPNSELQTKNPFITGSQVNEPSLNADGDFDTGLVNSLLRPASENKAEFIPQAPESNDSSYKILNALKESLDGGDPNRVNGDNDPSHEDDIFSEQKLANTDLKSAVSSRPSILSNNATTSPKSVSYNLNGQEVHSEDSLKNLGQKILSNTVPSMELEDTTVPHDVVAKSKAVDELTKSATDDDTELTITKIPEKTPGAAQITQGQEEPVPEQSVIDNTAAPIKEKSGFFSKIASIFSKKDTAQVKETSEAQIAQALTPNMMNYAAKGSPLDSYMYSLKVQINNTALPQAIRDQAKNLLDKLQDPVNDLPSVNNWLSFTAAPMSPSSPQALAMHQWAFMLLAIRFSQLGKSVDKFLKKNVDLMEDKFDDLSKELSEGASKAKNASISNLLDESLDQIVRYQNPPKQDLPLLYQYVPLPPSYDGGREGGFSARPVIDEEGQKSWHLDFVFDLENLGPIEIKAVSKFPELKLNVVASTFNGLQKVQECLPHLKEKLQDIGITTTSSTARLGKVNIKEHDERAVIGTRTHKDDGASLSVDI